MVNAVCEGVDTCEWLREFNRAFYKRFGSRATKRAIRDNEFFNEKMKNLARELRRERYYEEEKRNTYRGHCVSLYSELIPGKTRADPSE